MRVHRLCLLGLIAGLALGGLGSARAPAQPVGPPNEVWCNRTANGAGAATTINLVSGVASRGINVCGFIISATAAATAQFFYGTGVTCGTGSVFFTAQHAIPAGGFIAYNGSNAWFSVPLLATNPWNLCVVIGGTGPAQVTLFYSQF